jgi:protein TonB
VLRAGVESSLGEGNIMQHEESTFASLWNSLRDVFFPEKLPPLVLESKPIPVVDRMATRQDPRATAMSVAIYALLILLFAWLVKKHVQLAYPHTVAMVDISTPPPLSDIQKKMGGGGGQKGAEPVSKGRLPKFAETQITPPKAPPMEEPKIKMPDPTIEVQKDLKMANNTMLNFGDPKATAVGNSMGNGSGTGIGNGHGSGLGPGNGWNNGGGLAQVGGRVTGPYPTYKLEPEFSEEARKAKFQGTVMVDLIVDEHGMPQNVHSIQSVGMGLDEQAEKAVRQWRFHPAMDGKKPVAVELHVEVEFQMF